MCGETWKTKNMCGEVYREGCGNESEGPGERETACLKIKGSWRNTRSTWKTQRHAWEAGQWFNVGGSHGSFQAQTLGKPLRFTFSMEVRFSFPARFPYRQYVRVL